ncbi:LamG-like jellyroll fold domain-containing protein [Flavobacterium foetidum]|uniref:LamG-like jellyroll fold domain-containing protein n=1 Tax=Flavobacterium foetidum TaxID=2026681 RepID=UPI001074B56D|nr:LamG-like jellyroll fold domain-containing protein [Flavobacterium foetidum]KAF2517831.1 LamG domain-containing protein [Flavobacterium foetidum]
MKKTLLALLFVSYLSLNAQTPIEEFNFNGTLNNTSNTISFMGTANYVEDRAGNVKAAQRLSNKALEAVIDKLPQESNARTISIWIKFNDIANINYIWGYGSAFDDQYCGLLQQAAIADSSNLSLVSWGPSNDVTVGVTIEKAVWYNYVITYEGVTSKIYINGKLLKFLEGMKRFTKGNIFRLGELNTTVGINTDIDDLQIYDTALNAEQIKELYESSKSQVAEVPQTSRKVVKNETTQNGKYTKAIAASEVGVAKKIEVYSQGQKIMGGNSANISTLPEGTYLLKITNSPGKKMISSNK